MRGRWGGDEGGWRAKTPREDPGMQNIREIWIEWCIIQTQVKGISLITCSGTWLIDEWWKLSLQSPLRWSARVWGSERKRITCSYFIITTIIIIVITIAISITIIIIISIFITIAISVTIIIIFTFITFPCVLHSFAYKNVWFSASF